MAEVTAEMVKKLRELTGARMLDCQKALKENQGQLEPAVAWLRKQNLAAGAKAEGKAAEEGMLAAKLSADGQALVVVELSANTDFVTKNDEYRKLLEDLAALAEAKRVPSAAELLQAELRGRVVAEVVKELAGKIGENIGVKRVERVEGEFGYYIHHDHKQGAVVTLTGISGEKARALGKDLAIHIVSAKPVPSCLKREDLAPEVVEKEREILRDRLKNDPKNAKKPPEILSKIVDGQLGKFYAENCLLDQAYIRDDSKSVAQFLKEQGAGVGIARFLYFKIGG